jgi:hypothetical protein
MVGRSHKPRLPALALALMHARRRTTPRRLHSHCVLRLRATHYTVVSTFVPALDVQGASTSLTTTSTIDAQFDYGVELRNPNRHVTMEYTNLNVATLYLGTDIGHSGVHLGGLRIGLRSSYTAPVTTSAMSLQVNNIVGDALQRKH